MPILCCYAKRRRASATAKSPEQYKRDIFGMRLARLDEFESLTPLMVVSGGNNETSSSSHRHRFTTIISRSPPPPRCPTNGKTMIVPLNSGKGCAPFAPMLAAPKTKGRSFESDTTNGFSTIIEDNENIPISSNLDKSDADFISIDRTTISYLEPRQQKHQQCECGISKPDKVPIFELPTPSYAPPPLPTLLSHSPRLNLRKELPVVNETGSTPDINNDTKTKKSPSVNSMNSLGSPQDSSFSMGSPLDTSASISGSFCGEGELNSTENGRIYSLETGKIEEESEQNGDIETTGIVTSRTLDSIKSIFSHSNQVDSQYNIIIPHSISEQFELMNFRECL
ncbi:unnamed protein product [Cercopithifilaria johnstoni]|uniref:Uncharacterized protein n=1 Tax=Cercopithifilaria johnstoni TaxID=2874296 RepID=A0A8J2PUZ5_9BILA|nr:unnamed protein product [Cercopithifilaria johnstoni]